MKNGVDKMQQQRQKFDLDTVIHATSMNKMRVDHMRKILEKFDLDILKEMRLKKRECKCCYYLHGKIGGAAMTEKPCDSCGTVVLYPSTCTGSVCEECSKKYGICTHCGGDINGKKRRKL